MNHGASPHRVSAATTTFDEVTSIRKLTPGRYEADVSREWTIGGKPNGGYLLAMLGRAASDVSTHADVVAASANYLRAPEPASVTIEAEVLRHGRSASQVRTRMIQEGQPCLEALMITADIDETTTVHWDDGVPTRNDVAYEDCIPLPPQSPEGTSVDILKQIEVRLEPASLGFAAGQPTGRGELRGWLTLPRDAPFDPVSLLFAVDALPPATFDIKFAGWVPTLELTAYVRALPAAGPVQVLQRVQLIAGGRFDEACYVWDCTGQLVAQSTQLAAIRFG